MKGTGTGSLAAAAAGAFLLGVILVVGVAIATNGGSSSRGPEPTASAVQAVAPTPTAAPSPSPTNAPPTAVTSPVATLVLTVEAFRSCEEIRAAGASLSEAERQFFLAQCLPQAPAASGGGSVPPQSQAASQPRPTPVERPGAYEFIGVVWPDEWIPVRYCVNPANPPIGSNGEPMVSTETFIGLVQQAFATWEQVPTSYISFSYQGLCDNDPFDNKDGVNTIGWGWLSSSVIGLTHPAATNGQFVYDGSFGQIYEMDIAIDSRYGQSFDNSAEYMQVDLPYILLHEIGHFIGLDHTSNPCSIMQPVGIGTVGLCSVDIEGVSALYPTS